MPRRNPKDSDTPRRRRRANAVTVDEPDRGLVTRLLLHSPKDTVAGALAFTAVTGIVANALLLQAGRHPSPMFGSITAIPPTAMAASPLPRPRPVETEPALVEQRSSEPTVFDARPTEPKVPDSAGSATKATHSNVVRPPAPIPAPSRGDATAGQRRVAAVQRALSQYGYGQLKPTGTFGSDTQAAIQKFERDRKLPITGQISERVLHELSVMIGHPID